MIEEKFVKIEGFTEYKVSNLGRVSSTKYGDVRILKPVKTKNGYARVTFRKDGDSHPRYVHRVVADTFLGKNDELIVNHKDGDKQNNNVDNLEFVTFSQNVKHAYDTKLMDNSFRGNQWVDKHGNKRCKP